VEDQFVPFHAQRKAAISIVEIHGELQITVDKRDIDDPFAINDNRRKTRLSSLG